MVLRLKLRELKRKYFEGDLTMPKTTLWMFGAICLLAGIVYGLCAAPLTHGVMIGCNNGNCDMWGLDEKNKEEEKA
ncbi:MAG: hypothetical protein NC417_13360 [Candidatus Gastranaerophilales bacterium]|nr:hypothetical protein [Candidatus Gastranaerophilales bacterium]